MTDKLNNKDKDRNSVISIKIKDKQALYMSYMPFISNGGLFVPTQKDFSLGEELFLLVHVMDEPEPLKISGKIIWVSPVGAVGGRPRGVGVQFLGDTAQKSANLIETRLGGSISLTRTTHTM